jgi:hypothetical protein
LDQRFVRLIVLTAFNSLVSDDLAASVAEWDPAADVRVLRSHADAAALLAAVPAVFAIMVQGRRDEIMAAGLPALAAARGGRLVWMADWSQGPVHDSDFGAGWIRVDVPFGAEAIRAALEAVARTSDDRLEREA